MAVAGTGGIDARPATTRVHHAARRRGGCVWPLAVRAQQGERMRRIGVLMPTTEDDSEGRARIGAFVNGLRDMGLTEGRNVKLDYRWATDVERLRAFASELVALTPDVILAGSTPTLAALHRATATIPIVFALVSDPILDPLARAHESRAPSA
jgi:putative tryptophan/tyrosine transport system substrate-binding protein